MPDKKPKRTAITPGMLILAGAGAFQAVQYVRAFHLIDSSSAWGVAGGVVGGLVVSGSLALAGMRLVKIKRKTEKALAWTCFITLLVLTPVFLTPVNYATLQNGALSAYPVPVQWLLAGVSALVVDIAMLLTAVSDGSLKSLLSDAASDAQRQPATLPATLSDAQGRSKRRSATLTAKLYRCECGYTDADRFVMSGHKRQCPIHQQARAGQPIPVDLTTRKEQPR